MKLFGCCHDQYETFYCFVEIDEEFFKFLDWVREGIAAVDPEADESTKKVNSYGASFNRIEFTDYNPSFIEQVPDALVEYLEALDDDDWTLVDDSVEVPTEGIARIDSSNLVITDDGVGWTFHLKHSEGPEIGTGWLYNKDLEAFRDAAKQQGG